MKNEVVDKITYSNEFGKFPPAKLKDLKKFIEAYKDKIIKLWIKRFILKGEIKPKKITTKV